MNRDDFKILKEGLIYFDSAATTLKPKNVIDKTVEYYENYPSSPNRGEYKISYKASSEYENARLIIAKFLNAEKEEIIFTQSSTEGLNIIANNYFKYKLKENDEIILTKSEHASNLLPWISLAKELNLNIKYLKLDEKYEIDINNLKEIITDKTKVISLAQMTNVIGDIRDLDKVAQITKENNIKLVVDAAQSIAHMKVDASLFDFLVFSGHKIYGPTGIGVLYAKKDLINGIKPNKLGGGMNDSFDLNHFKPKPPPYNLEGGTPNIAGAIALGEAIKNIDINLIASHENELKRYAINKLSKIKHIDIINKESKGPIISFNVNGIFSQDVAFYLDKYNIAVRAGSHCAKLLYEETNIVNSVRVSFGIYNTKKEIDTLCLLLEDKDKILKEMMP